MLADGFPTLRTLTATSSPASCWLICSLLNQARCILYQTTRENKSIGSHCFLRYSPGALYIAIEKSVGLSSPHDRGRCSSRSRTMSSARKNMRRTMKLIVRTSRRRRFHPFILSIKLPLDSPCCPVSKTAHPTPRIARSASRLNLWGAGLFKMSVPP